MEMAEERGISELHLGSLLPSSFSDLSSSNGNQVACNGAQAILDEALPLQTNSGQNPQYDGPSMRNINGSENVTAKNIDDGNSGTRPGADRNGSSYNLGEVTKAEHKSTPDTVPGADKNGSLTKVKCLVTPDEDANKTVVTKTYLDMCIKKILPNTLPIQTTNSDNNLNTNLERATPNQVNTSQNLVTPQASSPENNKKNTRVKNLPKDSIDYLNDRLSFGCSSKSWECIADYKGWNYEKIRIHSQKCLSHRLNPFEELIMDKDFADYKVDHLLEDLKRIPRVDLFDDFNQCW
ncbi:hypothetical protein SNE40_010308 [Patella caerulea]|uniref:Uncharacterized protein n=1 Tax=Patella caerulea TaxID=87958 RepID=A0AAN8PRG9_PATCE